MSLEYLRTDIMTGRDSQFRIVQAYSTVLASIMVGGLVYTSKTTSPVDPFVLLALFGMALPGFSIASNLAFMGEMLRIGRSAAATRGIEWWASKNPQFLLLGNDGKALNPLFVEAFYATNGRGQKSTRGYGTASYYLAVMTIFGGGLTVSLVLFNLLLWHWKSGSVVVIGTRIPDTALVSAAWLAIWVITSLTLGRKIQSLAEKIPDIPNEVTFGPSPRARS